MKGQTAAGAWPSTYCASGKHDECAARGFRLCTCECHDQDRGLGRGQMVTADDLIPGDLVADDFTAWAEVRAIGHVLGGVRIAWRLADGRSEVTTYDADAKFTLLSTIRPTCEGMGTPTFPAHSGRGDHNKKGSK